MFSLIPWRRERRESVLMPREDPFRLMRREFETLMDRYFGSWPVLETNEWGLDVEEKEEEVLVRAEVPGFEPGEVNIMLQGDVLSIEAEHKEVKGKEGEDGSERRFAQMKKSLLLPPGIDREKVEANYRNGLLEVHLPRTPEARPRRIEVKT